MTCLLLLFFSSSSSFCSGAGGGGAVADALGLWRVGLAPRPSATNLARLGLSPHIQTAAWLFGQSVSLSPWAAL